MGIFGNNNKNKQVTKQSTATNPNQPIETLRQGSISLVDLIAPSSVEVDFKHIKVGDKFYRTFFVIDYPRYVSPNWLSSLIDYKQTMNISMFIYPVDEGDILTNLKRKIAEMEVTIESDMEQGLEPDPKIKVALEDAMALQEELARGLEKFFQFGLYVTISADTLTELDEKTKEINNLAASSMLVLKPATLQMEEGYKTTLPLAMDKLYITRNMDTTSVASTFPFTSYEISHPNGILYGINTLNNSLVIIDRFSFENANEVVFGKSGSGKSFLVKLEILREALFGTEILIVDPEEEYKTLTQELGGQYISFSPTSEVKINPFALVPDDISPSQLGIKILSLHGLLKTMLGEMTPVQEAILDKAIVFSYKQKGITPDPATYKNEPPILEDLYKSFLSLGGEEAKDLAFRLEKFISGGFAGLFNQQTNCDIQNQVTVFSLKEVESVLRPIAMHVILDFVWNKVKRSLKKRVLVVDEAWYMVKHPDSAAFLQGIVKRARKYYLGVTTITQDIEDFLGNDYGKTILSNSSIQILLKQGMSEADVLAKTFLLSEGEKQFLLNSQVGEGLLFAGQNHVTTYFAASDFEYSLVTSKPKDVMAQNEDREREALKTKNQEPRIENREQRQQINERQELNPSTSSGYNPSISLGMKEFKNQELTGDNSQVAQEVDSEGNTEQIETNPSSAKQDMGPAEDGVNKAEQDQVGDAQTKMNEGDLDFKKGPLASNPPTPPLGFSPSNQNNSSNVVK